MRSSPEFAETVDGHGTNHRARMQQNFRNAAKKVIRVPNTTDRGKGYSVAGGFTRQNV